MTKRLRWCADDKKGRGRLSVFLVSILFFVDFLAFISLFLHITIDTRMGAHRLRVALKKA
ncbi:MAG: hypothetical protein COB14_00605 [Alphaproteobacteria bacterium]|nr:MAG: hypothetical protein COB14_00605 [Alphaproteobacteria bacterium]